MNKFFKLKRFIAILILVTTVTTSFCTMGIKPVYADSKDLTSTYINLMKGNSLSQVDTIQSMNANDLRVLALFLSNFFIPYGTSLDGESESAMTETMIDYLQNLGFNKDAAEQLIENVMKNSLNTSRKLYIELPQDGVYLFGLGQDYSDPGLIIDCYGSSIKLRYIDTISANVNTTEFDINNSRFLADSKVVNGKYYIPASQWIFNCAMSQGNSLYIPVESRDEFMGGMERLKERSNAFFTWCKNAYASVIGFFQSIIDWAFNADKKGSVNVDENAERNKLTQNADGYQLNYVDNEIMGYTLYNGNTLGTVMSYNFTWFKDNEMSEPVYISDTRSKELYAATIKKIDSTNGRAGNSFYTGGAFNIEDVSSYSDSELAGLVQPGQFMYVDWVGNIFVDMEDRRLVVVPACMNPRVFKKLSETDGRTYTNFISAYGFTILNSLKLDDIDANGRGKLVGITTNETDNPFYVEQDYHIKYGSTKGITWDTVFGSKDENVDAAKYFKKFSTEQGFNVGFNDTLAETSFEYGSDAKYVGKGANDGYYVHGSDSAVTLKEPQYNFTEYLLYDTLQMATSSLTVADETTGQNGTIIKDCILRDGYIGLYFTGQSERFRANSDIFEAVLTFGSADTTILQNILITYAYAYNNRTKLEYVYEQDYVDMAFRDVFPSDTTDIVWEITDTGKDEEIKTFIYYLLHPTQGLSYVSTWAKNKLSAFLIGWHEDMVGNTDSNSTTGMTAYLGMGGYVTVPDLKDMEWTAFMLDNYNNIIVYVIIIMIMILFCYALVGEMTWQRMFIGVAIFSFFALLPPFAINAAVDTVNTTADKIYSAKFDYWALCQTQSYLDTISQAETASIEDTEAYINLVLQESARRTEGATEGFYSGVRVKWMTPKRTNETAALHNELTNSLSSDFDVLPSIIANTVNATSNTQAFTDNADSVYLYRDFLDVYRYGYTMYHIYDTYNDNSNVNDSTYNLKSGSSSIIAQKWTNDEALKRVQYSSGELIASYVSANNQTLLQGADTGKAVYDTSSRNAINKGFLYNTWAGDIAVPSYNSEQRLSSSLLLRATPLVKRMFSTRSKIINDYNNGLSIDNNNVVSHLYGEPLYNFHFNIGDLIKLKTEPTSSVLHTGVSEGNLNLSQEELISNYMFALYSESPYYYFSNHFRDVLANSEDTSYTFLSNNLSGSVGNVKALFLSEGQDYFFNNNSDIGLGYGELRDFMNFHDFFYYVLPVLQLGIDSVEAYDDIYGTVLYDECSLRFDSSGKIVYDGVSYGHINDMVSLLRSMDSEELYKFWHNYNVMCLLNTYTPWLDTMEDCDYAEPEEINIAGKTFTVSNPLDPTTYYRLSDDGLTVSEGRYMVFSRSEMVYYGLTESDLTEVERKIIEVQDKVYNSSIDLLNYYTFADETLIHAYSMLQLFTFNEVFSQNTLGDSYILYPQGYELKAFTYDAYMRLILAESSGEPLQTLSGGANESIYTRIIEKTSLLFGLVLIVNDILAVYIVPLMRLIIVVMLFFMSVTMIVASAINLNKDNDSSLMSAIWKSLFLPLIKFAVISIALAFVVALFMSDGASGVTKSKVVVSLGDPTLTVFAMCLINALATYLYWGILSSSCKDLIQYVKAVGTNIGGAVSGAVGTVAKLAKGQIDRVAMGNAVSRGVESGVASSASQRGASNSSSIPRGVGSGLKSALGTAGAVGLGAVAGHKIAKADDAVGGSSSNAKLTKKYDKKASGNTPKLSDKEKSAIEGQKVAQGEAAKALSGVKEAKANRAVYTEAKKKQAEEKYKNSSAGKFESAKKDFSESKALFKKADTIGGKLATGKMMLSSGKDAVKNGIKSAPKRALQKVDKKTLNVGAKVNSLKSQFDQTDGVLRAKQNMAQSNLDDKRKVLEAKKREREIAENERHAGSKKVLAKKQAQQQQMAEHVKLQQAEAKSLRMDEKRKKLDEHKISQAQREAEHHSTLKAAWASVQEDKRNDAIIKKANAKKDNIIKFSAGAKKAPKSNVDVDTNVKKAEA